jgi:WD40 repeat protein
MAACCRDSTPETGETDIWDTATGQEVQKLEGHTGFVTAVAFSHDGSLLASASWDGTVRLWDPAASQEVQPVHEGATHLYHQLFDR